MGSECEHICLRAAGVELIDCVHKTPPATEEGLPYIAIPQMKEGRLDFDAPSRLISHQDFLEWTKKAKPQENDVVLSRRCNPGETAYVPKGAQFALGQNLVLLRADNSRVYPPFLRWLTKGPQWWEQVRKFLNVGAVFDSLRCADIPNFELALPPLPIQRSIAHILGTLDDKIELNRRMNRTLEVIARAIFKSWFIDFDPVHAKSEGREPVGMDPKTAAFFPDSFQDSPLGKIPKGWEIAHLAKHIEFALGGDWGKEAPDDVHTEPAYCIRGTDLPAFQAGQLPKLRLRYLKPSSLKKRSLKPFDLVFEVSGGSPTQSTGRSLLLHKQLLGAYDRPIVCTNFCRLVRFSSKEFALFSSFLLSYLYSIGEFFTHETGTTTIKNFAFRRFVEGFDVVIPDERSQFAFFELLSSLLAMHIRNGAESHVLMTHRDALLPALLTGKIGCPSEGSQKDMV